MTTQRRSIQAEDIPELPEGVLPCDRAREDGVVIHSLTAHALAEMERHRWIESEHAGSDVGNATYEQWLTSYWTGWTRSKLLEHLYGWRYWRGFGDSMFGLLSRGTVERTVPTDVLHEIAHMLGNGGENLDVINWAIQEEHDLDAILWLLDRIDINAVRHRLLTNHIRLFIPS